MSRCRRRAALNLLLMILPVSAWGRTVCFGETVPGNLSGHLLFSAVLIFLIELAFYVAAQLSWVVKKQLWPTADGAITAPWRYAVAAMATLTSVLLGVWGTFLGPMYRPILFGESSSALWHELPAVVQLLFSTGYYSWLMAVGMIALLRAAKHSRRKVRYFEIALIVQIGVLYSILWAIYQYTIVLACPVSSP